MASTTSFAATAALQSSVGAIVGEVVGVDALGVVLGDLPIQHSSRIKPASQQNCPAELKFVPQHAAHVNLASQQPKLTP